MNATLENPVITEREEGGRGAYEIFADSSGSPAGFTEFFAYTEGGVKQRIFPHTVVKEEFGGHGLASKLVKSALDQAIEAGYEPVIVCPYIKGWVEKHPDYADKTRKPEPAHLRFLAKAVRG
ncbi:GNAT family N-acetyltransferase [Rothia nasimurium]|uniref:GNAT family N-acetyltransferase n=1 Tax=Rothia nasimurium TaxID=85336 RepID=UPI001F1BDB6B|nr:GNAT family N-acetyltransferase [Rothia nasimurium]